MLDVLYLKTIEKKEEITEFFENITEEIDIKKVEEIYKEKNFNKNVQDKNFAAIDGSFNRIKYMAGYIYALTSQTIVSKSGENVSKEFASADINTISTIHDRNIDKILSLDMNIFELKSTLNTLRKHKDLHYMLIDGSIHRSLITFRTFGSYNIPKEIEDIFPKYYKIMEDVIKFGELPIDITIKKYVDELREDCSSVIKSENPYEVFKKHEIDIILYLESIEQLLCIYYLLSEFKDKLVCISKTSSSKRLFKEKIPDSAVIEYTCNKAGFTFHLDMHHSKIIREVEGKKTRINYPVKNMALSESNFYTSFVKLENKSNVLKIEIPRDMNEVNFIELLEDLKSISVEGYPHILKKAHDEVKIENKFMERLQKNLGIYDKTGRDMLN